MCVIQKTLAPTHLNVLDCLYRYCVGTSCGGTVALTSESKPGCVQLPRGDTLVAQASKSTRHTQSASQSPWRDRLRRSGSGLLLAPASMDSFRSGARRCPQVLSGNQSPRRYIHGRSAHASVLDTQSQRNVVKLYIYIPTWHDKPFATINL